MSFHRDRPPVMEPREPWQDFPTPTKAKIQGAVEFCDRMNIPYFKEDVFRTFGVSRQRGYEMLKDEPPRRRLHHNNNNPNASETRGRKKVITPVQIWEMERVLETAGREGRALTWEQLGSEAGVEASGRTVKRTMETMDYHKCIACQRGWVSESARENRLRYARLMLEKYPEPEDWYRVRFSAQVHFGWGGPQGKLRIIPRPGERYCVDCLQERDEPPDPKDGKRQHCWAAVGFNFKSDIYFSDVPGTGNGKMSQRVYIDGILEPIVKPWLEEGQDFVLEEDGDSAYGSSKSNIVRTWKTQNNLEFFFSCAQSPDLSPMENCWQAPKQQHLRKYPPRWDDETTTRGLIREGWANVSQKL